MKIALINPVPGTHVIEATPPTNPAETYQVATIKGFEWIFTNVVASILSLAGIVLFIMLIVGGLKLMTSGGNPESAAGARKTITVAIAGMVLISLSFLILVFIQTFTGANVTVFNVTQ